MEAVGRRGRTRSVNIWPGFVDGLASLLLVVIFVLMVFVVAQFYLSAALTGRDEALQRLEQQVTELADLLALERSTNAELRVNIAQLSSELQSSLEEEENLSAQLAALTEERDHLVERLSITADEAAALEQRYQSLEADKEKIEMQLAELLILKSLHEEMTERVASLETDLAAREEEADELRARLSAKTAEGETLTQEAEKQTALTKEAQAKVDLLNRQIAALRQQLARLAVALEASEARSREQEVQIANLGQRLNAALASKVQELARYRSEFFGRLREVLGDRQDIRIVGDRFVFQSEVLFDTASAELGADGKEQLSRLAGTLKELSDEIPSEIDWILRIDGHTDRRPISTSEFASNWELSTARAIAVVKFLIGQGIAPERLAAAGFGEFQPLVPGKNEWAFARNRRIELKFDQR